MAGGQSRPLHNLPQFRDLRRSPAFNLACNIITYIIEFLTTLSANVPDLRPTMDGTAQPAYPPDSRVSSGPQNSVKPGNSLAAAKTSFISRASRVRRPSPR